MSMFSIIKQTNSEHIKFCVEKRSNFKAIIAINSTALGPALGDITFIPDEFNYREATSCACFLSQRLSNIYAFLGLHYGGGKIIAQGKPSPGYEEVYFRSLARHVNKLNGRFIIRSSSYINKKLIDYIKVETGMILPQSVIVNEDAKLNKIKQVATLNTLKEVSTKLFSNRDISKLNIGLLGTGEDVKKHSWLIEKLPMIKVFDDASKLPHGTEDFDILLLSATSSNASRLMDMFKVNFKAAIGICEEEVDMEVYEDVMWSKGIQYIPGYLVENFECFFFCQDHINKISGEHIDLGPFEIFIREKLAYLFDESARRKERITRIINDFADARIERLQLLK